MVVVGSGAGGGLIAGVLAQAGLDVVVLEAGGNFNEPDFTGLELPAFQQLFWRGGPTPSADYNVTSARRLDARRRADVNWSNCLRTPGARARAVGARVRRRGRRRPRLRPSYRCGLDAARRQRSLLGPQRSARADARRRSGARTGRSRPSAATRTRPRYSPDTAGYIGLGDRSGAKLDVRRTYLRDAVAGRRARDRALPCRTRAHRGRPRRRRAGDVRRPADRREARASRCARRASWWRAARSSRRRCCCALASAARPSAATCTCTR